MRTLQTLFVVLALTFLSFAASAACLGDDKACAPVPAGQRATQARAVVPSVQGKEGIGGDNSTPICTDCVTEGNFANDPERVGGGAGSTGSDSGEQVK